MYNVTFSNLNPSNMNRQMKHLLFALSILICSISLQAQNSIGISPNNATPDASAILDVSSTSQGVLVPRMTQAQRNAISSPANGLMIYQTDDTPGFYFYNGSSWGPLGGSSSGSGKSIIPFSSGPAIAMTTTLAGPGNVGCIGFGNSVNLSGSTPILDLTTSNNMAFMVPTNGTINEISGFFSTSTALSLIGTTISITAKLFEASQGSNSFTEVPGAVVTLSPVLTGIAGIGTTTSGTTSGLSIPVSAGKRYMMVFTSTASGISLINTISGYASAGLTIQ